MIHFVVFFFAATLLLAAQPIVAQDTSTEPTDSGLEEKVEVNLVMVDALVMNKKGQTVPDLTKEDFVMKIGEEAVTPDTFDVACPIGAADDPGTLPRKGNWPAKTAPQVKRKIVFAFDYYFLARTVRGQALGAAQAMIAGAHTDNEEIMLVALADGLRVEQRFTSNKTALIGALRRMEHDSSLWAMEHSTGVSGKSYFRDMWTLMDVLESYEGRKAVVLFSQLQNFPSNNDLWFNDVAMHALAARTAIYPSMPNALIGGGTTVSDDLARFANQSGGRMGFYVDDPSVAYRRAQRDLSCTYTLGIYVDPEAGRKRRNVHVSLQDPSDRSVRHAEMIKLFTDEQLRDNRARAAFIDPGPFENPLVRVLAFPAYPTAKNAWDTLIAVHIPMPVEQGGAELDLAAAIKRGNLRVDKYKGQFKIDPPPGGGKTRPVTFMGDSKLKSGQHTFTVVASKPGGKSVVSGTAAFSVPEVPDGLLVLRGPLFARVVKDGLLIRGDAKSKKEKENDTKLDEILGEGNTFEPLIVHQIEADDELLMYWNACVYGKSQLNQGLVVRRRFLDEDGKTVHELDEIPLAMDARGKNLMCRDKLDKLAPGTLASGEYQYHVTITYGNGDMMAAGKAPLHVK